MEDIHSGIPIIAEEVPIRVDPSNVSSHDHCSHDHVESIYKISRFPVSMREFGEERNYIVPKAVAIGPYHREVRDLSGHRDHTGLQEMEDAKEEAARFLFRETLQEIQGNVSHIALSARSWYDTNALKDIDDDTFALMMFHDACFLLLTILAITDPIQCNSSLLRKIGANINVLLRDIFLLENQIPWFVLEALMDIRQVDLTRFIGKMGRNVQSHQHHNESPLDLGEYKPPHLLGLFHFYQSGHDFTCPELPIYRIFETCLTSANELAEIGIKLTCSKTAVLKKINLRNRMILFPKLFLPSLQLNEKTACWLLNMAAFEACTASHDCTVSSYLALLAMLMDREEDVHELRSKHLIHGEFSNKQVLNFFKGRQASNIRPGYNFYDILEKLEGYRHKWSVWIAIHRFVYNNVKTIVTVLSIISVLIAIFKTLLSLKQPYHASLIDRAIA